MTLVITPGAPDANSYADLAEAADYIATLTFAGKWPTTNEGVEAVLRQAALRMNTLGLKGRRVASEESQALAFPRYDLVDSSGFAIASNIIPRAVKIAQIELALWLAASDRNADPAPTRLKSGTTEISGVPHQAFPDHVMAILRPFLDSYGACIKLVRA